MDVSERDRESAGTPPPVPTKPQQRDLSQASPIFEAWLRRHVPGAGDVRIIEARTPSGAGVANETILVDAEQTTDGRLQPKGYVIRVDTAEHLFKDMDLRVHYQMYATLHGVPGVPVPRVLGFEEDRSLIGERFFVMDRMEGRVPADSPHFTREGWVLDLSTAERDKMWRDLVAVMVRLHALPRSMFPFLERPHLGKSGLEQSLNYWLSYAKWCKGDEFEVVRRGGAWLLDNLPNTPTCLSWGDSRLQNVMFQDGEIVSIFDWDMVSLGGAECDLAWWITLSQGHPRPAGLGGPKDIVTLWEQTSGRSAPNMDWHMAFMAFQTTVVMIKLPQLLHRQGLIDDAGYRAFLAHPGARLAGLLDLPWDGPPLAAVERWDD